MFLWAQQDKHGTPGRDVWTGSTGLGLAVAGGHESAAIRQAWVSGDPAGLSQRRSGGLESAAVRRRDLPWTAGLGEPRTAAWTPANGGLGEPRTAASSPANSRVGEPRTAASSPANGGLGEPRTAACSEGAAVGGLAFPADGGVTWGSHGRRVGFPRWWRRDLRELERWAGWAVDGGVISRERRAWGPKHRNKTNLSKTKKQNEVKGRRLRLGLVFCHGAHSREDTGTRRRGRKLK